eukprot:m.26985 g.26985  ORF g.26985 m.26985 type:complete len:59 (+) comp29627_c0_seq1:1076-1252(+)
MNSATSLKEGRCCGSLCQHLLIIQPSKEENCCISSLNYSFIRFSSDAGIDSIGGGLCP